jgi:hypothetical protein
MQDTRMNQLGLLYIRTCKYHKETRCVAIFISNKLKCLLFSLFSSTELENRRAEQVCQKGGLAAVGVGRGDGERG